MRVDDFSVQLLQIVHAIWNQQLGLCHRSEEQRMNVDASVTDQLYALPRHISQKRSARSDASQRTHSPPLRQCQLSLGCAPTPVLLLFRDSLGLPHPKREQSELGFGALHLRRPDRHQSALPSGWSCRAGLLLIPLQVGGFAW